MLVRATERLLSFLRHSITTHLRFLSWIFADASLQPSSVVLLVWVVFSPLGLFCSRCTTHEDLQCSGAPSTRRGRLL